MSDDDHMTWHLAFDVLDMLELHGYRRHDTTHTSQAISMVCDLARVYEGTRDVSYGTYLQVPPAPYAGPGRPVPGADQAAVILTGADVSTVLAALDQAADYKRNRAETCAGCPDQSCSACQSRLREAQAYDQMAAQMLSTARPARAADTSQPEPGGPGIARRPADPAAGTEAGQ